MDHQAAQAFLEQYRALLRCWSMVMGGFQSGDGEALRRSIIEGRATLQDIGERFPDLTYSAEMLRTSTERNTAWFTEDRPTRPDNRKNR